MNALQQKFKQFNDMQRADIAAKQQQLAQLQSAPEQIDLTPLMAATDMITGSNLARSYRKPNDGIKQAMQLQAQIDRQKQGLMQSELRMLAALDKRDAAAKKLAEKKKKEEGPKQLTQNMIKKINEGNAIPSMLANVNQLIGQNVDKFGPLAGRLASANPYDTRAQGIEAEMRAKSQAFGRFMEGGVLRAEDEKKYRKMFPALSDTPEVASKKLEVVQDLLRKKQMSDVKAFEQQGYDLTGLELPEIVGSQSDNYDQMSDAELLEAYNKKMGIK